MNSLTDKIRFIINQRGQELVEQEPSTERSVRLDELSRFALKFEQTVEWDETQKALSSIQWVRPSFL